MGAEADFLQWLDEKLDKVAEFEAGAAECLRQNDGAAYAGMLREKAGLVADLYDDAQELLAALPDFKRELPERRLKAFSASAERGIDLDSLFYMSALLYPDEHMPGEPNNFEIFVDEMHRYLAG